MHDSKVHSFLIILVGLVGFFCFGYKNILKEFFRSV